LIEIPQFPRLILRSFSTAADNQTSVEIHVVQGERAMSADNKTLGRFILDGIPPSPRGMPQVEVSFDIDANGILNVKAKDKVSGKEQSIRIEASSGLTDEDIEKMKKDAELHSEEDKKKKDVIDVKNTAEAMVYTAEKSIKDNTDKISDTIKKSVEEKIANTKKALEGTDTEQIKNASKSLSDEMQKIGEEIMKASQAAEKGKETTGETTTEKKEGQSEEGSTDGNKDIRDAEFEEDKKNPPSREASERQGDEKNNNDTDSDDEKKES